MRVLLSDTWASGGASTFVSVLARELHRRGHVIDVVLGYRTSPAVEAYRDVVGQIFEPPYSFSGVVLTGDYDAIHITEVDLEPPFDYARRVRALGLRAPVVVTSHTSEAAIRVGGDALVFVSEEGQELASFDAPLSAVIPNGVDADRLASIADVALVEGVSAPLAVWVGRVSESLPQKDFLGFGYAIHTLLETGWDVLVLDGSPIHPVDPAEDQLRRWFGDRVRYANQVPQTHVLGALSRAAATGGALISTSRVEGAPFIALEALALGCPVIAPRITGYAPLAQAGAVSSFESLGELLEILRTRTFCEKPTTLPEQLTAAAMADSYLTLYEAAAHGEAAGLREHARRIGVRATEHRWARTIVGALRP